MQYETLRNLFEASTVALEADLGNLGVGFFVAPHLILTCAHVIRSNGIKANFIKVSWQGKDYAGEVERLPVNYPELDLAVIRCSNADLEHPCVYLDKSVDVNHHLYSYAYPLEKQLGSEILVRQNRPLQLTCHGYSQGSRLLTVATLAFNQLIYPSFSGAPLLNEDTGMVCGIIKRIRSPRGQGIGKDWERGSNLGEAIPTSLALEEWPDLVSEQQRFHKQNRQWVFCLAIYQANSVLSSFQVLNEQFFAEQSESGFFEILKLRRASWPLILKGDYIDRDQQEGCLAAAKKLADYPGISLLVLRGLPGNGKTAMLLWLAYELSRDDVVLCNTKRLDFSGWLKELRDFSRKIGRQHFYLIIDDVFREEAILNELKNCQERFPLTIIGTTLTIDDRHGELQGLHEVAPPIDILPPSDKEKKRVLDKVSSQDANIKARLNGLTNEAKRALLEASTMLVLICQVSEVKHFDLIVGDIIKRLPSILRPRDDLPAYEIFGTICSFSHLGIISPADIVASCVSREISRKVTSASILRAIDSPSLRGLVVTGQKAGYDGFEAFHEFLAQKAVEVRYNPYPGENPPYAPTLLQQNLESAIKGLDIENELHRRWVYASLRRLIATGQREVVRQSLNRCTEKIHALQARNNVFGWFSWAEIYKGVGLLDESERCLNAVLSTQPHSDWDWSFWLGQVERQVKRGESDNFRQQAQHLVSDWLQGDNEDNVGVRAKYLGFVGKYASESEAMAEIDKATAWLQIHRRDINVRTKYLQLVKDRGSYDQKLKAVCETLDWLEESENRTNSNVRAQYLRLISQSWVDEVKGQVITTINYTGTVEELIQREIYEIPIWLNTYKLDKISNVRIADKTSDVRAAYLDLIEKRGTQEQKQKAVKETTDWLREYRASGVSDWLRLYPDMSNVFAKYFALIQKTSLDDSVVQSIIVESWQWINEWNNYGKPVDQLVWTALLPRLEHCKDNQIFYAALFCALKQHEKNDRVIGIILAKYSTSLLPEERQQIAYQLSRSIDGIKLPNSTLRRYLLKAANVLRDLPPDLRDFDTAKEIYLRLIRWCKGKYKQDALETLRDAREDYEQLLWLKQQLDDER
jgi:V8-like Glu-specific endopeptidase